MCFSKIMKVCKNIAEAPSKIVRGPIERYLGPIVDDSHFPPGLDMKAGLSFVD